jgi:LacI family gluconate utilization system Gnt-I transcriptional repressor
VLKESKVQASGQNQSHKRIATMSDVARIAGVTTTTVSRALRTPDAVSEKTREKIKKAISETGFVLNYAARTLVSQRSQIIVALFPTMMNSVFSGTMEELSRELSANGYNLLVGETSFDIEVEERLLSGFMGWRPAALILTGSQHTDTSLQILDNSAAPVVELWNLPKDPFDLAVGLSNRDAAYAMTKSLHDWGYRRIAFLNLHYPQNDRSVDRSAGYRDAMADLGIEVTPDMEINVPFGMEAGREAVARVMNMKPRIDALFCASDTLAVGALMGAVRAGLRVPEDIAIAGFGDVELASIVSPGLTTVGVPRARIGSETARIVMERLNGTYNGPSVIDCGFTIIRRESA